MRKVLRVVLGSAVVGLGLASATLHAQVPTPGGSEGGHSMASIHMGGSSDTPRAARQRLLQGAVRDADGKAVQGAVIYIKNGRNSQVQSVVADEHGAYRFGQLDRDADYTLWAQVDKRKGPVKTLSSYDTRDSVTVNLKVE